MNSKRLVKIFSSSAVATALFVSLGVAMADPEREVRLDLDGQEQVIKTSEDTLAAALLEEGVATEGLVVTPSLSTKLTESTDVKIRSLKPVTVTVDGSTVSSMIPAATVEEVLHEEAITTTEATYLSESPATAVPDSGITLVVSNPKRITLVDAGEKSTLVTASPTVETLLDEENVTYDRNDRISKDEETFTTPGMTVKVVSVDIKNKVKKIVEAPETQVVSDPTMIQGKTEIKNVGSPKILHRTFKIVYADGSIENRRMVREKIVSRGAPRVILKGTKVPAPVEPVLPTIPTSAPPGGGCAGWQPLLDKYFGGESGKACQVMLCESGGRTDAQNPVSSASGLFQFIDGTWGSAKYAVPGASQYARAAYAPGEIQIAVAAKWLQRTSWSQWSCA